MEEKNFGEKLEKYLKIVLAVGSSAFAGYLIRPKIEQYLRRREEERCDRISKYILEKLVSPKIYPEVDRLKEYMSGIENRIVKIEEEMKKKG